jgi:type II secretory ATPase GspE/PulE/Tfp pilus assembly ATPase PilB-like protein
MNENIINPVPVQASPEVAVPTDQIAPEVAAAPAIANPAVTIPTPVTEAQATATQNALDSKLELLKNSILSANVPQVVLYTISYALDLRSSDIHIEPLENTVRIRYRIDGVLQPVVEYPTNMHPAVVSRIKIMSNLKIDEQRIPQDGRTNVTTKDNREMDLRVSTVPTVNGEKIVMRIQDKSRTIPSLDELGIKGNSLKFLHKALKMPNGIILTSGPTGSGKTTTLYSCLTMLNKPGVNILTIEDPVEIQMDGLNQSQVKPDIGYDFATGLRASLRQDPDIMMVGEIRDKETINVAIECSLTGHLVLSTIHTNSAVETLTRIVNMGVPPYLIASTIDTIIAQRLVRVLCPHCKAAYEPEPELKATALKAIASIPDNEKANYANINFANPTFYQPVGCNQCGDIGYLGRIGVYEVMPFTVKLKNAVLEGGNSLEIQALAQAEGMITLEQAAIIRTLEGVTSLEEVYRIANINF